MARLRTVKENYYARIRHTGINEITIPLKTKMYKDALLRLKEVELYEPLIINGENIEFVWQSGAETKIKELSLESTKDEFIEWKRNEYLRPSTIKSYELALNHFISIIGKSKPIRGISNDDIQEFKKSCRENKYKVTTINIRLRSIKVFLNWLKNEKEWITNTIKVKQLNDGNAKPKYFPNVEFDKICKYLTPYLIKVAKFYLGTGCRLAEPFTAEIDGDWMTVTTETSKTHKSRDIELTPELKKTLIDMQNKTHLPSDVGGAPIRGTHAISYYSKSISDACKKAGLKGKSLHCLRHTFAVRRYLETKDIYGVAKELGHSNVTTSQIYTKFNRKKLAYHFPDLCK